MKTHMIPGSVWLTAVILLLLGILFVFAPGKYPPQLAMTIVGRSGDGFGETVLVVSNACSSEIQVTRTFLDLRSSPTAGAAAGPKKVTLYFPLLKPGETASFRVPYQGQAKQWKFRVEYFSRGRIRQVRDKLFGWGLSGRLLRHFFNPQATTDWISDEQVPKAPYIPDFKNSDNFITSL